MILRSFDKTLVVYTESNPIEFRFGSSFSRVSRDGSIDRSLFLPRSPVVARLAPLFACDAREKKEERRGKGEKRIRNGSSSAGTN